MLTQGWMWTTTSYEQLVLKHEQFLMVGQYVLTHCLQKPKVLVLA